MKRSMMQVYVLKSDEAVPFYQQAFGAELRDIYKNEDGTFIHSELNIQGQILCVAERNSIYAIEGKTNPGNVMQFCLHYGQEGESDLRNAYEILKEGAEILMPLAPCEFSPLMTDFIDKFGVRWCLFV